MRIAITILVSLFTSLLFWRRKDSQDSRKSLGVFNGEKWPAAVVRVIDGDTVWIDLGRGKVRVRLAHIDAPEHKQVWGAEATEWLGGVLPEGSPITVRPTCIDCYGRVVAEIYQGDSWINYWLVKNGMAWALPNDNERLIADAMLEAQQARLGLWQENYPTPPWLFRKQDEAALVNA